MACRRAIRGLGVALVLSLVPVAACSSDAEPDRDRHPEPDRATALIGAINEELSLDPDHDNLRAVLVHVDGKPVVEKYYDWPADTYWDVDAITRTVLSILVGIALSEGTITGLDETLAELLPDRKDQMLPAVGATTLRELLTMTGCFADTTPDRTPAFLVRRDPVGSMLEAAVRPAYDGFEFSNQGAHVLSAVLAEATGMSVLDYARSRLFDPLGIDTEPADEPVFSADPAVQEGYLSASGFAWPVDPSGLHIGSYLLKLRPADLAKIGQLFLDQGKWDGKQVVPASWVGRATAEQVPTGYGAAFGFGWWVGEADSAPAYFSSGFGGQLIEVVPSRRLVVVVASEIEYDGNQGSGFSTTVLTFLVDHVIAPAVKR
jgi:CubicO group peptidase (beta-lactamase class C family)